MEYAPWRTLCIFGCLLTVSVAHDICSSISISLKALKGGPCPFPSPGPMQFSMGLGSILNGHAREFRGFNNAPNMAYMVSLWVMREKRNSKSAREYISNKAPLEPIDAMLRQWGSFSQLLVVLVNGEILRFQRRASALVP